MRRRPPTRLPDALFRDAGLLSTIPVTPCHTSRFHDMPDFHGVEWFRQDIVAAQVEHFRPQPLVGHSGRYDQERTLRRRPKALQNIPPTAVRQVTLANHD